MYELTTIVEFEAAHCIKGYPGKCKRLHGHNWKVEVTVRGTELDELGMLIDFHDLKREVNSVIDQLDHYYLNEIEPFCELNPTAENLAKYIFEALQVKPAFAERIRLASIKIWESPKSAVLYRQEG